VGRDHGALPNEIRRSYIVRCIIDMQVKDVVETSEARIIAAGVRSADDVRLQSRALVQHSPERRKLNAELRKFLYANLYFNPVVHGPNMRAVVMLEDLFKHYLKHTEQVGEQARKRFRKIGKHRAICDYLAGMTDRYAMQEHARIFGPQG
jgi:dGTPase